MSFFPTVLVGKKGGIDVVVGVLVVVPVMVAALVNRNGPVKVIDAVDQQD